MPQWSFAAAAPGSGPAPGIAMEDDLPYGPWKKFFTATWNGYPLQAYQNADRAVLMLLFEKKGDEVSGVLVLERRGFVVDGNFSGASIAQRDLTFIEKHSRNASYKFAVIDSTPAFVPYSAEELANEVTKQYGELESVGKVLKKALAELTGAKIRELKRAEEKEAEALWGDPLTLLSIGKRGEMLVRETGGAKAVLGITAGKEAYELPLDKLRAVGVVGGSKEKRLHALHVVIECAVGNGVPCMLFDADNSFSGIGLPNRDNANFKAFGMGEPTGFSLKSYELGKGLFVDLELIESDQFLAAFNIEKSEVAAIIKKVYEEKRGRISFLGDLVAELNSLPETADSPRYVTNKATRVLETIQKINPSLFAKNISEELSEPWKDGTGKVIHVSLAGQRPEISRLVIYSLLKSLLRPSISGFTVLIALAADSSAFNDELGKLLQALYRQGKGFAVEGEHEVEVSAAAEPRLLVEIVGDDVVLTDREDKTKKRITLRPAYSHCSEYTATPAKKEAKQ